MNDAPDPPVAPDPGLGNKVSKAQCRKTIVLNKAMEQYVMRDVKSSAFLFLSTGRVAVSQAFSRGYGKAFVDLGATVRRKLYTFVERLADSRDSKHAHAVNMLEQLDSDSDLQLSDDIARGFFEYAELKRVIIPSQRQTLLAAWEEYQQEECMQGGGRKQKAVRKKASMQLGGRAPLGPADKESVPPATPVMQGQEAAAPMLAAMEGQGAAAAPWGAAMEGQGAAAAPMVAAMEGQGAAAVPMVAAMQGQGAAAVPMVAAMEGQGAAAVPMVAAMEGQGAAAVLWGAEAAQQGQGTASWMADAGMMEAATEALKRLNGMGFFSPIAGGAPPKQRKRLRTNQPRLGPGAGDVEDTDEEEDQVQPRRRGRPPASPAKWRSLVPRGAAALLKLKGPKVTQSEREEAADVLRQMNEMQQGRKEQNKKELPGGKDVWRRLHSHFMV